MPARSRRSLALALAAGVSAVVALGRLDAAQGQAPAPSRGAELYAKWCAGCHGEEGRGDGPAADRMLPRPRDFTRALYQVRTTPSGSLPTDDDLMRIIDRGMPGTAMPGWQKKFSPEERREILQHLKSFSPFFETESPPERVAIGKPPRASEEGLKEGRALYEKIECWKCHGQAGRGDGPSAPTLRDDAELPIRAADLTESWNFNGGSSVEEIFARLKTGLDGTPMPSFTDLIDAGVISEEGLWRIAQYVRSLSPEKPPVVREVLRADRIEGELPASPDDSLWDSVERFYFPLVGQIIAKPRWFAPTVEGVWVQALHNGRELALRLVWHDPSRSPSTEWMEWQEAMLMTMAQDSGAPLAAEPLPDAFAVQFPRRIPEGPQRPYFLMGTATEPVVLWRWQSEPEGSTEAIARGLGRIEPQPASNLTSSAVFDEGEWRLQFTRALVTPDTAGDLQFEAGRAIPIAFFAWDGSNGERDTQGAISSWYYIYLAEPTQPAVYASPAVAALVTAVLGLFATWRAQRQARGGGAGARGRG